MKTRYKLPSILALGLLILLTSCEKILNQDPVSQVKAENFWKSNSDAALGVAAIYDNMQATYRIKHFLWGEFRSDNFISTSTSFASTINLINNTIINTDEISLRWNSLYTIINTANLAIDKIPSIPLYDQNLLGEAYALRAYAYFDAVRVWGDVPLYTKPLEYSKDAIVGKTERNKILNEVVVPDMLEAEKLITQATHRYRFSKASILLLQANVYWYLKEYNNAKASLDKFFALNTSLGNVYKLTTTREDWVKLFTQDSGEIGPELIFSIKYDILEDGNRASGVWETLNAGAPQVYLSPLLENKWISKFPITKAAWDAKYPGFTPRATDPATGLPLYGDWRYFESREAGRPIGTAKVGKYLKGSLISPLLQNDATDIIIYRYAGVLLLKAMVENRINFTANRQTAVDLINQVRTARQLPTVLASSFTNQGELENFILDERQLELFAEGQRWWDLVNTDKAVEVMAPINGQTEQTIFFPIYFKHLIDNPKL